MRHCSFELMAFGFLFCVFLLVLGTISALLGTFGVGGGGETIDPGPMVRPQSMVRQHRSYKDLSDTSEGDWWRKRKVKMEEGDGMSAA